MSSENFEGEAVPQAAAQLVDVPAPQIVEVIVVVMPEHIIINAILEVQVVERVPGLLCRR